MPVRRMPVLDSTKSNIVFAELERRPAALFEEGPFVHANVTTNRPLAHFLNITANKLSSSKNEKRDFDVGTWLMHRLVRLAGPADLYRRTLHLTQAVLLFKATDTAVREGAELQPPQDAAEAVYEGFLLRLAPNQEFRTLVETVNPKKLTIGNPHAYHAGAAVMAAALGASESGGLRPTTT